MDRNYVNFKAYTKDGSIVEDSVVIGKNVVIYPGNILVGDTVIEDDVVLYPNNYIFSSHIGKGSKVMSSFVEDSVVHENVNIGPFAHLRPNSNIADNVRIGNFVEIKNSKIEKNTKVSHLTYVGDADVGENVNVGCGVVFINYNGKTKSRSKVGNNSFIGSSVNLIAPVNVGNRAYVCAGTTVDKDVEDEAFVIGRSRMVIKPNRSKKYLK